MKFNNIILVTVSNMSFENRVFSEIITQLLAYIHDSSMNKLYKNH